eukprot:CAMPEP_0171965190 /NCGR_PEP_ID=MMETSP0993-20121228/185917_1 /TAXON_ID=483369 /ORGANISM="non described non described, Strain CCMP2098" /LENGTH=206 /DNA_ID=CAMNT_0012614199 /DNA_START=1 /DNA_END=617 /DNA_ORIENTATION=+
MSDGRSTQGTKEYRKATVSLEEAKALGEERRRATKEEDTLRRAAIDNERGNNTKLLAANEAEASRKQALKAEIGRKKSEVASTATPRPLPVQQHANVGGIATQGKDGKQLERDRQNRTAPSKAAAPSKEATEVTQGGTQELTKEVNPPVLRSPETVVAVGNKTVTPAEARALALSRKHNKKEDANRKRLNNSKPGNNQGTKGGGGG